MITEVTIIGAGPYGLSLAAFLRARDIPFRILGIPMGFWQSSMPRGMSLKSEGCASSIYEPASSYTLSKYCAEENRPYADLGLPVTLESFISYGLAFQQRFVPNVEEQIVSTVTRDAEGFLLSLGNGESFTTRRLVLAVGVGYFAYVPTVLAGVPDTFVTHSSRHADLNAFAGRDVGIIGAGASALDLAALLNRAGAHPVVIARGPDIEFQERPRLPRSLGKRLLAPTSGVGPGWPAWLYCKVPLAFHYLPGRMRLKETKTRLGPVGCWFAKDDVLGKMPIFSNSNIEGATIEGGHIRLHLSSAGAPSSDLTFDHVIAATGYRVEVDRITFLDEAIRRRITCVENTPILSPHFESSISGLYFVGPAAAYSFGPLQRFAFGARFAANRVSRRLAGLASNR